MKFKFNAELEYQQQAIESVVQLLEGLPLQALPLEINLSSRSGLQLTELGIANNFDLDPSQLHQNLRRVQSQNGLEPDRQFSAPDFSIEMETGTGKTYVYLRTILRLAQVYSLRKFIIVVPSIAIREGVLKSLQLMAEHFRQLYPELTYNHFVYDSRNLSHVVHFARSTHIQIMIINIQSFIKELPEDEIGQLTEDQLKKLNVIHRHNDRMQGYRPIEYIQKTKPVVVIDEPQNLESEKARTALRTLNPCLTLRYSATHRELRHLVYRLDPIRAYDLRLVKRIEVASVRPDDNFNDAYARLLQTDNKKSIRAQLEIHVQQKNGEVKPQKIWVKQNDNLFELSKNREIYRDGYLVRHIDTRPGNQYVEFANGLRLTPEQALGSQTQTLMQAQIRETIEQHLLKERTLRGQGIKVLSLFFLDHVKSYRIYKPDGTTDLGQAGRWFEEAYRQLTEGPNAPYPEAAVPDIPAIHDGYFARDRKGRLKDTTGTTRDDEDTYQLIMRDKERLLDLNEPLRFIFSHSALREGWDNPNVFQVCTLNETNSPIKKRQEIGRGLRLPVNTAGERVQDERICRLTVIANESYEDFARSLQQEYEHDLGVPFGKVEKTAFAQLVKPAPQGQPAKPLTPEESKIIWKALVEKRYLNALGEPQPSFNPSLATFAEEFRHDLPEPFQEMAPQIVQIIQDHRFERRIRNAKTRFTIRFHKERLLDEHFVALWDRIKLRTRYRVRYQSPDLIATAAAHLKDIDLMPTIRPLSIQTTLGALDLTKAGITSDRRLDLKKQEVAPSARLPDLLLYLQNETHLTRQTLSQILIHSGRLNEFFLNPQQFMLYAARTIRKTLADLALKGIEYEKIPDFYWEVKFLSDESQNDLTRYLDNLYQVHNTDKTYLSHIDIDSEVERRFARQLDTDERIAFFFKLPRWFQIDTPIGPYNPDWAFVTKGEKRLFFVRETKSTLLAHERRTTENNKIACGRKHFEALGVDFGLATSLSDVKF